MVTYGWFLPIVLFGVFLILNAPLRRPFRADDAEVRTMLNDEFRQANVARAQRLALAVVLIAQVPLAILVSDLSTAAAVTIMGVGTVALATTTIITSFLYFDRD